jgi:hypothetical protein
MLERKRPIGRGLSPSVVSSADDGILDHFDEVPGDLVTQSLIRSRDNVMAMERLSPKSGRSTRARSPRSKAAAALHRNVTSQLVIPIAKTTERSLRTLRDSVSGDAVDTCR